MSRCFPLCSSVPSVVNAFDFLAKPRNSTEARINNLLSRNQPLIDRHANDRIDAHRMQAINFLLRTNPSSCNQLPRRGFPQGSNYLLRKPLQQSFCIDMRVKESAAPAIERLNHFQRPHLGSLAPAVRCDPTTNRIEGEDQSI